MVRHDLAIYHKYVKALSIKRGQSIIKSVFERADNEIIRLLYPHYYKSLERVIKETVGISLINFMFHCNIMLNDITNFLRCGRHLICMVSHYKKFSS